MASSDDEGDPVAQCVTNYHFVDDKDEPILFSVLPIQWKEDKNPKSVKRQVFLHGTADDGLQKIYKQVKAWKFELWDEHPEISVLSKENIWIKLQKPRKSFEDIVRTILITVHCLDLVKKDVDILEKSLWDRLQKIFSSYEVRPSENDLLDHLPLIDEAIKHDETLSKSKFLLTFLKNPKKRNTSNEDVHVAPDIKKSKFIVEDYDDGDDVMESAEESESEEEEEERDVCAICDNGGTLVCCEGRCLRAFHPTEAAGKDSFCESLRLSKAQRSGNFVCANCQYKKHQCFVCGRLGSSDKSSTPEVFPCVSATCGHFYHPKCVAKLLHPDDESEAEKLQKTIVAGESFTCPAHRCHVCKQSENTNVEDLHFAICRRCPKAYHRECLPREIAFEDSEDADAITRAWENILPNNRILIYCLEHEIDAELGTPVRDHIVFPDDERRKRTLGPQLNKRTIMERRKSFITENSSHETIVPKTVKRVENDFDGIEGTRKRLKCLSGQGFDSSEKIKRNEYSRKPLKDSLKSSMQLEKPSQIDADRALMGENKFLLKELELFKSNQRKVSTNKFERTTKNVAAQNKESSPLSPIDAETRKRIVTLMEKKTSSITLEEVITSHKVPSTHAYSSKSVIDKNVTLGKVDASVEAVRVALRKLDDGCSVEDAKAVCGPEIINQIIKWRNKLKVYLAPFLHGMRYTSFGRHFTKVDKLQEIVDKLHCYVQNDDVIVDFACGANDFSWLMKKKLDENGKKCSFKNYDVIQPKNDFYFEKRDWMKVRTKELPTGSKLIMGLNPPFGVKAALANKFIDKALFFRPKLLILIVPEETERLDKKKPAYDLIWEDEKKLSGKSFYLPGSVDVNDNQMEQWNVKPPRIYLWSRSDWTAKHKDIALKHGHLSKDEAEEVHVQENHDEAQRELPVDISPDRKDPVDISKLIKEYGGIPEQINDFPEEHNDAQPEENKSAVTQNWYENFLPEHETATNHSRRGDDKTQDLNGSARRLHKTPKGKNKRKPSRGAAKTSPRGKNDADLSRATETPKGMCGVNSPYQSANAETLLDGRSSEFHRSPSQILGHFQHGLSGTGLDYGTGLGGIRTSIPNEDLDEISRRYSTPFASRSDHAWPSAPSVAHDEYGIRGSNVHTHYAGALDEYSNKETNVRQLLRLYGPHNDTNSSAQRSSLHGQDNGFSTLSSLSSTSYGGAPGLASDSTYGRTNSSAMQRYAPRLDELNHTRASPFGAEPPVMGRSSIFDNSGSLYPPGSNRPGFHPDTLGFAPGPQRPFSYPHSSGWLNE